jgi:CheY-specific phosphatase CheX
MIQDNEILHIVLDRILDYFNSEIKINIKSVDISETVDDIAFNKYTASICITGKVSKNIIFSFSNDLVKKLTKEIIPKGFSKDSKESMVDYIPSELANIIMGLTLNSLPHAGKGISINTPKAYRENELYNLLFMQMNGCLTLDTEFGSLICYITDRK